MMMSARKEIAETEEHERRYRHPGGPVELETSRDRNGTFEPDLIKKRETVLVLADTLASKIVGMYELGMSFRDISSHLK